MGKDLRMGCCVTTVVPASIRHSGESRNPEGAGGATPFALRRWMR